MESTILCRVCAFSCPAHFHFCGMCGTALRMAGSPAAERRPLTVMFVDLVGSTALSERMDAEELREVVRDYQKICAAGVERFAGC